MSDKKRNLITLALIALVFVVGTLIGRACAPDTADSEEHEHPQQSEGQSEYICPMHPQIRQQGEGTCPICGMDLVPVDSAGSSEDSLVESTMLSDEAAALAQLRTEEAALRTLQPTLQTFGSVETSESQEARIAAWASGRIERLYVQATGEEVRRGQRLARIYSPQLAVALQTYRDAAREREAAEGNPTLEQLARGRMQAAEERLRNAGVSPESLSGSGDRVTLRAPASGVVLERLVQEGDYVNEGDGILTLSSLARVWVQLEIYERDIDRIHLGQRVALRDRAGNAFEGTISFVSPTVDESDRVLRARVEVQNPDEGPQLRPGQLLDAEIVLASPGDEPVLAVPRTAVLWTGERSLVYVEDPTTRPPSYLAIEVTLGARDERYWEVRDGLYAGELVVTNAAFVVDANLQLEGGGGMMGSERNTGVTEGDDD